MTNSTDIINSLSAIINDNRVKAPDIPLPTLLIGVNNRNGISAREIARKIISRQNEAGAPIGLLPDGSENISEKMEQIRVEEIVKHLLENLKVTVVVPAGIDLVASGTDATGTPVTVKGVTIKPTLAKGIIQ